MSEEDHCSTLTHSTRHRTSRRTAFQDELEAAVSERAVRTRASHSNSNDFNHHDDDDDDDDDVLKELLKTRRKKIDVSRTKPSISDFTPSDDEENIRPKRVSFLKSQRNFHTLGSDSVRSDTLRSDTLRSDDMRSDTLRSDTVRSDAVRSDTVKSDPLTSNFVRSGAVRSDTLRSDATRSPLQSSQSESPAVKKSQSESSVPLNSDNSQWGSSSEGVLEATPPTPAPRQRAPPSPVAACDVKNVQTQSRAAASPESTKHTAGNSGSDAGQDDVSVTLNTHSRPIEGAESTGLTGEEPRDQEKHQLGCDLGVTSPRLRVRSPESRPGSSRRARRTPLYSTESRYLGTLKVLEQKACLQETGPDTVDSLRAAIYQDWLKRKEENLQATFRAKKQEEKLKEERKAEEKASKKAEARASYEAWKEKKREALRETIRKKQEELKKLQREMEDKEEKKETAKRVFDKWKQEHDELLRAQREKQLQTENRLKEEKRREKEERKSESRCSFAQWSDRKKEVIEDKLKFERRKQRIREIEDQYEKEEKEKTALELYDQWLRRKELEQKQERRERKMRAGVVEEPPPAPWSPPNRTIPFGK
ncbi:microtubule-associated protein 9 [Clarias gariepinus]|uniref:microtubule-associated protein 9 n=1 Tax=Clarias gariepinus TaxID=13013 RepID=UPI00234E3143|nr:microtubule-associated protein 9 [Clarias gariepinus]